MEELEQRRVLAGLAGSDAILVSNALQDGVYHVHLDDLADIDHLTIAAAKATLDLSESRLEVRVPIDPGFGTTFTIIDILDPESSVGNSRFQGLPEGSTLFADGFRFTITYVGGADGNDVELQRPAPGTRVEVIDGILTVTDAGTASDNPITLSIDDQSLLITDVVNRAGAAGLGSSEVADVNGAGKR
jgi:hypothetical protein